MLECNDCGYANKDNQIECKRCFSKKLGDRGRLIICEDCGTGQSDNSLKFCQKCGSLSLVWGYREVKPVEVQEAEAALKAAEDRELALETLRRTITESGSYLSVEVMTTPSHPTKSVEKICGVICKMQRVSPKVFTLQSDQSKIDDAMNEAIVQIKIEAVMLGANAVIGLQANFESSQRVAGMSGNSFSVADTRIYLAGTAVVASA
jgi:uncharacterized protein YbjQ (UPF0145 family)|tara:strand:- start:348 stop:965 length:618 start_codon:yes stop_codon:yes gene_type:complete